MVAVAGWWASDPRYQPDVGPGAALVPCQGAEQLSVHRCSGVREVRHERGVGSSPAPARPLILSSCPGMRSCSAVEDRSRSSCAKLGPCSSTRGARWLSCLTAWTSTERRTSGQRSSGIAAAASRTGRTSVCSPGPEAVRSCCCRRSRTARQAKTDCTLIFEHAIWGRGKAGRARRGRATDHRACPRGRLAVACTRRPGRERVLRPATADGALVLI